MNQPEIIVYARERWCPDVERTRARLGALGLSWIEHDVEADPEAAAAVERLTGRLRVPTVVIGENVLVEPDDHELDGVLRAVGFDVSALAEEANR